MFFLAHLSRFSISLNLFLQAWSDEFNGSVVPPITFVVVQKRHHTKIFPADDSKSGDEGGYGHGKSIDRRIPPGKSGDRSGNISPGMLNFFFSLV